HATSGYVGLSQLKKLKPEAAGSSGAVQALRMENDAPVVGPDAPTANSKMVKLDIATADWSLAALPRSRRCRSSSSSSSPRRHTLPHCHQPQAHRLARAGRSAMRAPSGPC